MNVSCDIIRDLLPLYAEDMVSEDSKKLVDDHLCRCDECVKILGNIKKGTPVPVETDSEPLNKVKKMIIRRRALSVMASILTLLTLASFVNTYLFTPFQLTCEQALDDFYVREDGAVVIDYSAAVIGRSIGGINDNRVIHQYSTRYDTIKAEHRPSIDELYGTDGIITEEERLRYEDIDIRYGTWETNDGKRIPYDPETCLEGEGKITSLDSEYNWWYFDPTGGDNDVLLYDAGKEVLDYDTFAPVYPLIFFGCIVAALVLLILQIIIKMSWVKELSTRLAILCGSAAFSTLFVSSGRIFTSSVGIIDQYWGWMIGTNTVFLTLTVLFWRQLHLLNRQDKGE